MIYHLIVAQGKRNPEAIAIAALDRTPLTYSCLQTHITEIVAKLNAMGLSRGNRLAIIVLPNRPKMWLSFCLRMEWKADGNASGNVASIKDDSKEKNTG